jgi:hypothetical protein
VESTLVGAGNGLEILAIAAFRGFLGDPLERLKRDVALPQRDLFGAGDAQALALFEDLDEMAGLDQRGMRAGIEPGKAAAEHLDIQIAALEIGVVDVRDLDLAAGRRLDPSCDLDDVVVIKV